MPEKKHKREEIVAKLRQADVVGHRCTREAGSLSDGMKLPPNFIENLPAGISASIRRGSDHCRLISCVLKFRLGPDTFGISFRMQ